LKEEDLQQALKALLRSDPSLHLSDAVVDAILSQPTEEDPKATERILARFAATALNEVHPEPVRKVQGKMSFGQWMKSTRKEAKLTVEAVAAATGKEPSFIEQVEGGRTSPFELEPRDISDLISLYRLHVEGLAGLLANAGDEGKTGGGRSDDVENLLALVSDDLRQRRLTHLLD
jgi:transcriptional regulator with XRE-family HTH domain